VEGTARTAMAASAKRAPPEPLRGGNAGDLARREAGRCIPEGNAERQRQGISKLLTIGAANVNP
jgi:hypothetical protein